MIFQAVQINRSGAVAQLGARVNGIHEVAGSIPASSTKPSWLVPSDHRALNSRISAADG